MASAYSPKLRLVILAVNFFPWGLNLYSFNWSFGSGNLFFVPYKPTITGALGEVRLFMINVKGTRNATVSAARVTTVFSVFATATVSVVVAIEASFGVT